MRLFLLSRKWSILVNVLCVLEKSGYSAFIEWVFVKYLLVNLVDIIVQVFYTFNFFLCICPYQLDDDGHPHYNLDLSILPFFCFFEEVWPWTNICTKFPPLWMWDAATAWLHEPCIGPCPGSQPTNPGLLEAEYANLSIMPLSQFHLFFLFILFFSFT